MEIKKLITLAMALPIGVAVVAAFVMQTNDVPAHAAAPIQLAGKGTPPDGLYECNKISGSSYIHLGTLEIKGKTYRGLVAEGGFHPYTIDASGNITWTAGLVGMPDGWKLRDSQYQGPDEAGHPRMTINYTSKTGNAEVMDAVKEK